MPSPTSQKLGAVFRGCEVRGSLSYCIKRANLLSDLRKQEMQVLPHTDGAPVVSATGGFGSPQAFVTETSRIRVIQN